MTNPDPMATVIWTIDPEKVKGAIEHIEGRPNNQKLTKEQRFVGCMMELVSRMDKNEVSQFIGEIMLLYKAKVQVKKAEDATNRAIAEMKGE